MFLCSFWNVVKINILQEKEMKIIQTTIIIIQLITIKTNIKIIVEEFH